MPMNVYLDNSATTKVDQKVVDAMLPYFTEKYGNPSSLHSKGCEAREAVELARGQVANLVGAKPSEIVFTSGGTEGDNLAIIGAAKAAEQSRKSVVCSNVEHPAVLETCKALSGLGFSFSEAKVNREGVLELSEAGSFFSAGKLEEPLMVKGLEAIIAGIGHEKNALG